ncbi:helicase-associated domain-containing protein [Pseudonocardia endophytica]|uniref:XPB/Ssl2-like helicase family protein n=1 Tax=Pseudonocardia endophytica TaxID=401976 RepID=A0A4V2PHB1_PSEEN|nr:helicase-associated domain-containing protein [Pseudonocardia endophytica]TCK20066.1 XPB/Ssl2-like helicase family protein [Pseudonocardia endophytica]
MPTPLVDWLRGQDDETLAALLRVRPDLAVPPPADFTVLATRAGIRASVQRACEELDTVSLAVLEALVVADADREAAAIADVGWLLGPDVSADELQAGLTALRDRALAWGPDDAVSVVPAAREVAPPHPGGLGRPSSGPAATADLPDLLAAVPADEQRVLDALVAGPPIGRSRGASDPSGPVGRLVAKGLLLRVDPETVELPRQVGIALRGDRPMGRLDVGRPDVPTRDREPSTVDGTGAGAALELLRHADLLLESWGRNPPAVLRSGGLGVRDLKRTARDAETDEPTAALLAEVLLAADLVGESDGMPPEWLPTTSADAWIASPDESRWAVLARSWLDLPRLPGLVGRRDDQDRPIPALSEAVRRPPAARDRRRVLQALAELPPGRAVGSPAALAELLAWRAPRRGGRLRDDVVDWTVSEGTTLGVVALDALTTHGRVLLDPTPENRSELAATLAEALPAPVDHVLLQADLTAVAPGRLDPELAHELGVLAEIESAGGAAVYRFTEQSLRRALDTGRTADDVREFLTARSRTPVPQSLSYLVDDVARRHGRLRGGAAASFLRSDDEVLISEVLAHPATADLDLRRIAPTVVVSTLPLADVLEGLRTAGFSPAAEDSGGAVLDLRSRGRRAEPRRRGRGASGPVTETNPARQAEDLVARLRSGDTLAGVRRSVEGSAIPVRGSTTTLASLQDAARNRQSVWIGYVDAHGVAGERVLAPTSVGGGVVEGRDALDGELRRIQLHRITSIAVVDR